MFSRKKKKPLFGANIEKNCLYCRHNASHDGQEPVCALGKKPDKCKKFVYDPLRRAPKAAPAVSTDKYKEEDFKL